MNRRLPIGLGRIAVIPPPRDEAQRIEPVFMRRRTSEPNTRADFLPSAPAQGHSEAAEELYRKAFNTAQEQEAKLWELRAAVSLARLRRDQGRPAEARNLLASVYGWFTEGFDTPDLKGAKALLYELPA
jgi:predicted ATPase